MCTCYYKLKCTGDCLQICREDLVNLSKEDLLELEIPEPKVEALWQVLQDEAKDIVEATVLEVLQPKTKKKRRQSYLLAALRISYGRGGFNGRAMRVRKK